MKKRTIIVGKAGAGKDHFANYLCRDGKVKFKKDVSFTTRPPRVGEEPGYTYNYISEEEFLEKVKEGFFYEAVNFKGWFYGTSKESWDNNQIFIMTPSGIKHITEEDRKDCTIVYIDIAEDVRRERISKRSDADSVERRIKADEKDFEDFTNYDLVVTNPEYDCEELLQNILNTSK